MDKGRNKKMNCTDQDCQLEMNTATTTGNLRWWGYKRTDGKLMLRGFHDDYLPIEKAKRYKTTFMVYMPFASQNQNNALRHLRFISREDSGGRK